MRLTRAVASVTASAAAKVNLAWRVGPRRPDGYHSVQGVLQTIDVTDRLVLSAAPEPSGARIELAGDAPVALTVEGAEGDHRLLAGNIVFAAARALAAVVQPHPTAVVLHKSIPVAAGLGGGSADAAATLVALNVLWSARLPASRLVSIAAEVGSDVPAILLGGLVHASGRGETVRRIGAAGAGRFVLGVSDARIAAGDAYAAFDRLPGIRRDGRLASNDLEAAAIALHPPLAEAVDAMRAAGAAAFVTGSGPTVVGAVGSDAEARAVADACAGAFRRVIVASPTSWGVRLRLGDHP